MITENKRIEFWNFLTTEKFQPRPKGITIQRLAVLKPAIIASEELWLIVITKYNANNREASEFYRSNEESAICSRTDFWSAVQSRILHDENKRSQCNQKTNPDNPSRHKVILRKVRRKRF
jgi:DNA polymerase sigma